MKKLILNFANNLLSKEQMKTVKGGVDPYGGGFCRISTACSLYVRDLHLTYTGTCVYQLFTRCYCQVTVNGQSYTTDPGTTSQCES